MIAFIAVFIGRLANANETGGIWLTVVVLPLIGFPLGILCIIILLVVSAVRRAREARDAQQ